MTPELQNLIDRDLIAGCIASVARGEDRRDAALLKASYWPNAEVDFGIFQGNQADYIEWVVPSADAILNTQHIIGQSHIELGSDQAKAETHIISYHRVDAGEGVRDVVIGGRYLDLFEKRDGEWRIAERKMLYDWSNDWGESADWSNGLMGVAFSDPRFPGRSKGDWSEEFFASA